MQVCFFGTISVLKINCSNISTCRCSLPCGIDAIYCKKEIVKNQKLRTSKSKENIN